MTYIGESIKRVEDKRFITGKGNYTDDIKLPLMTNGCFVRSPYAHAKIKGVDISSAKNEYKHPYPPAFHLQFALKSDRRFRKIVLLPDEADHNSAQRMPRQGG